MLWLAVVNRLSWWLLKIIWVIDYITVTNGVERVQHFRRILLSETDRCSMTCERWITQTRRGGAGCWGARILIARSCRRTGANWISKFCKWRNAGCSWFGDRGTKEGDGVTAGWRCDGSGGCRDSNDFTLQKWVEITNEMSFWSGLLDIP